MSNTPAFFFFSILVALFSVANSNAQTKAIPAKLFEENKGLSEKKDKKLLINNYTLLGKYYSEIGNYELGLKYLTKAKKLNPEDSIQYTAYNAGFSFLFKQIGALNESLEYEKRILSRPVNDLGSYYSASNLGGGYLVLNQKDSALFYFKKQLKIAYYFQDYIAIASAHNNLGLVYSTYDESKTALIYYNKALHIFDSKKPAVNNYFPSEKTSFRYSILENKGRTLYSLKKYSEAIQILAITTKHKEQPLSSKTLDENLFALFDSYLKLKQYPAAKDIIKNYQLVVKSEDLAGQLFIYRMKLEYAISTHNQQEIASCYNQLKNIFRKQQREQRISENAMSQLLSSYLINEMQEKIEREKEKREFYASKLEFANSKTTFTLVMSLIFIFLVGISVYLYIQSSRNKKRKLDLENQSLQIENEIKALKIQVQERTLTDFAIDYNKNKERENYFIQKLKGLAKLKPTEVQGELSNTISEIQMRLKIDDKIEDLTQESQQLQEEFREKLMHAHPDLTKSDIQLCLLLRLELSNKEIAAYRSVSADSVKIFKNRLRNKLQLESAEQLVDYLKSI